jgi:hypothetical protein
MAEVIQKKKDGCGKYFAIGCLSLLIIAGICGYFAYRGIRQYVSKLTTQYTATVAAKLPDVGGSEQDANIVLNRLNDFTSAIKGGKPASALELTSNDINILIQKHPNWKEMAGKVYVKLEGDKINGEISIPLEKIGNMFKGRYLNGSAVFRVEMVAGRLLIFIDSLNIAGKTPPEEFMKPLRAKNLAENTNNDPELTAVLEKLESLSVRSGVLRVIPKQVRLK